MECSVKQLEATNQELFKGDKKPPSHYRRKVTKVNSNAKHTHRRVLKEVEDDARLGFSCQAIALARNTAELHGKQLQRPRAAGR